MTARSAVPLRSSRAEDEALLAMVRARASGLDSVQIAATRGRTPEGVRIATNRVRAADLAESGEPAEIVERAYW